MHRICNELILEIICLQKKKKNCNLGRRSHFSLVKEPPKKKKFPHRV